MAAEHERIKNTDKKAKKEEQYKHKKVGSPPRVTGYKYVGYNGMLCVYVTQERKLVAASGAAHLNETGLCAIMAACMS